LHAIAAAGMFCCVQLPRDSIMFLHRHRATSSQPIRHVIPVRPILPLVLPFWPPQLDNA
jgi:hypothetical protein